MQHSAGIVFIYDNKILLVHPTSSAWRGTYGFPKGLLDNLNESVKDAAIREVEEEIGIIVDPNWLQDDNEYQIEYTKNGKVYKILHYYLVELTSLSQIGLSDLVVSKEQLQTAEVDWAGFLSLKEAKEKVFHRQVEILKYLCHHEWDGDMCRLCGEIEVNRDWRDGEFLNNSNNS